MKRRKELALYVGRAIVLEDFYHLLQKEDLSEAEAEIGFALKPEERAYIKSINWSSITTYVSDIRDALPPSEPGVQGVTGDAAGGW